MSAAGTRTAVALTIATVVCAIIYAGCIVNRYLLGNKQLVDTKQNFHTAYVLEDNGKWVKYRIASWNDYDESDNIQISTTDGVTIYTHASNVKLTTEQ